MTNLVRELGRDDRGFEFTLLGVEGALGSLAHGPLAVDLVRLPGSPRALRVPARVLYEQLVLPMRARAFDLLYCVADIAPAVGLRPTVVLSRNLNIYDRRWYDDRRTRMLERLARAGARRASLVVFPSRAAADEIAPRLGVAVERVRIVPYGVSLEAFDDLPAESSEPPYLFLPAAVERHKNVEVLIRALPLVRDQRLQAWVAGHSLIDPSHRGRMEALARELGVEARVRFLGPVPYRQLLRFYRGARALVFPSFIETFGHPLLEAMAAGTPIVASDIPAFREIAGGVALFFPVDAPDTLAAAVDRLEEEPQARLERVRLGRERAARFTWSRSVDALCAVFEEVLRGRGGLTGS